MDFYYHVIYFLTVSTSLLLITVVFLNRNLGMKARLGLIITYILIILGASCEYVVVSLESGIKLDINELNILIRSVSKFARYAIIPIMPVIASKTLFEVEQKDNIFYKTLKTYLIIEETCMLIEFFYLMKDPMSSYHEIFYQVYILTFVICTLYMFANLINFSKSFQDENKIIVAALIIFIVFGVSIQLTNENVKSCWLTIAIASTFVYIYYNELIRARDALTTLLNQNSYYNYIERLKDKVFLLIVFDVDEFKYINDTFGHTYGDKILKLVGQRIKEKYQSYGRCYRIGGDEFAVIIEKDVDKFNEESLKNELINSFIEERKKFQEFPYISYGSARYNPGEKEKYAICDIQEIADKQMYAYKQKTKQDRKKG